MVFEIFFKGAWGNRPRLKVIVLFAHYLVLSVMALLYGQHDEHHYQFNHINTINGLSQSSVIAMEQDTLGRMWIGTRDGLNLYDGTDFKVYRNEPNEQNSISNSDILSIMEDSEGYLWIGTYNGLNRYDPVKDGFKRFIHSDKKNTLSDNTVWAIEEGTNGDIWIGTSNGLSIYNKEKDTFTSILNGNSKEGLHSNFVLSIFTSNNGSTWIGTSKGFYKVESSRNTFSFHAFMPNSGGKIPFVQTIAPCDGNSLCIGTKNMGLLKFDLISERFLPQDNDIPDDDIRAITTEDNGTLWLGTSNGLTIRDIKGNIKKVVSLPYEGTGLSHNFVKSLFTDKSGAIWIGTYYGGIDIWDNSNTNFTNFSEFSEPYRLGHKVVSSMVADHKGRIYLGTEGGGISIFSSQNPQVEYITTENTKELLSNNIKSLYWDNENLFIGTFNKGLKVYDPKRQQFNSKLISNELNSFLANSRVYAIEKDGSQNLWIGTFGDGLFLYDLKERKTTRFPSTTKTTNGLSDSSIRTIMVDRSSNVWIGTQSGLNLLPYSTKGYSTKNITCFFFDEKMKSGDDVLSVFQDTSGSIWVGLRAKGLFKFDGNLFRHVPIRSRKKVTSIYAITQEEDGLLWMSSNQGLIRYEIATNKSTLYTQKDGLVGNEFNSGAVLKLGDSRFYFGGLSGVTTFDSRKIDINKHSPQVILTDFKIQNKSVTPTMDNETLDKSLPYTKAISLTHDKANFSITFAIPNYINPGSNRYKYRMVGLDNNWTITDQTNASYTIQKPGSYTFEVMGANNDGVWNAKPTALEIQVKPAPWLSPLAYAIYVLIFLAAILWLAKIIRSRTRLKHKLELEYLERKRNREMNDAKLRFFTNISHEFRTPLTLIIGPLQQLLEDYKGSRIVYKKLLVMESNAKQLLQLINRLMDFRKLEHKRHTLQTAEGNVVKFLKEIYFSFVEFAKSNGFDYKFISNDEEILLYYDRPRLEQVFYNLISNAFKYTPLNGKIEVRISKGKNQVNIEVCDSGPGIKEEYREKVFERFFEIPEYKNRSIGQGTGIGLSIAKSIVDNHKGKIEVLPNVYSGSTFAVSLPLGKSHLKDDQIIRDFKFSDDLSLYGLPELTNERKKISKSEELTLDHDRDTVLLAEDNVPLRNFMKEILKEDYNVLEAGDGREALKKALRHLPALIVSDVMMPEMVGTELCSIIKEDVKTSHIPFILLTSRTSLVYKVEGLESGADDYISKPFNNKEFQLRVKNLIDSSKRLRHKFAQEQQFVPNEIAVSSIDEELLRKALRIVENNISNEQFDIPTFSIELGVSRTLLFTKIKAWTNMTPNEFIQEIRMKRAAQLLEQDKLNISQIAYKVGFRDPKYFSKCFQKKFGITPTTYSEKFFERISD